MKVDSPNSLTGHNLALSDEIVADYLRKHPAFFKHHEKLLTGLSIPHASGGAVSLLERQVTLLRERNREFQDKIDSFMENARENDDIFEKTRSIVLEIIRTTSLSELSETVEDRLTRDFAATSSQLFFTVGNGESIERNDELNYLPLEQTREALGEPFDRKRAYCGTLEPEQADLFFPHHEGERIVSAAIIPIHLVTDGGNAPGIPLLVIGSDRANHFNSKLDTLFLDFIGEVLGVHIARLPR